MTGFIMTIKKKSKNKKGKSVHSTKSLDYGKVMYFMLLVVKKACRVGEMQMFEHKHFVFSAQFWRGIVLVDKISIYFFYWTT